MKIFASHVIISFDQSRRSLTWNKPGLILQEIGHWGVNFECLGNNAHYFTNYFESKMCKYCLSLLRHQNGWWLKTRAKMNRISESRFSNPGHTGTPARRVLHTWLSHMGSRGQKRGFQIDFSVAPLWFYHLRKKLVVVEKGQIVIILYWAFLLDNLLDFLKLHMKIILLSKPNLILESTCLCL